MARKKAQDVTPESVDDMTDEQLEELRSGMEQESGEDTGETNDADGAQDDQQGGEKKDPPADSDETEKAASDAADAKDGEGDDEGDDGKAEHVPFKRFDYERNRRKKIEEERAAERQEWERRFDALLKSGMAAKPEQDQAASKEDAMPDPNADPMGALNFALEKLNKYESESSAEKQAREEAEQQQRAQEQLLSDASQEFQELEQADPTVRQAYDALVQSFGREGEAYGLKGPQLQKHMAQTEIAHIQYARQNRIPLDSYIKGLASARGWAPQAQQEPDQDKQGGDKQSKARAQAQERSKTLSNSGGSPGVSDGLSPDQILEMSDKEFDALIEKYGSVANALAAQ